jgi:hypothetical protein
MGRSEFRLELFRIEFHVGVDRLPLSRVCHYPELLMSFEASEEVKRKKVRSQE